MAALPSPSHAPTLAIPFDPSSDNPSSHRKPSSLQELNETGWPHSDASCTQPARGTRTDSCRTTNLAVFDRDNHEARQQQHVQ